MKAITLGKQEIVLDPAAGQYEGQSATWHGHLGHASQELQSRERQTKAPATRPTHKRS